MSTSAAERSDGKVISSKRTKAIRGKRSAAIDVLLTRVPTAHWQRVPRNLDFNNRLIDLKAFGNRVFQEICCWHEYDQQT